MLVLRLCLLSLFLSLATASLAHAKCHGAVILGGLHDAYLAALTKTGATQIQGATTLLVILGGSSASSLARLVATSGVTVDTDKLEQSMEDANQLALQVLANEQLPNDTFHHSLNIDWLGDTFLRTGCMNSDITGQQIGNQPQTADAESSTVQVIVAAARRHPILTLVIGLCTVLCTGVGLHRFRQSHTFKKGRAERHPRMPISIKINLTSINEDGDTKQTSVTGIDVSIGGMKLEWPDPAPVGTNLKLILPIGVRLATVAWSNAYFAGIIFDDLLSQSDLDTLQQAAP